MKSLKKYAFLAALLSAAVVQAQQAPPPRPPSADEMRLQSEEIKKQIDADHKHVLHLQALARKEKDVIKLTCINDKLVQMKAQMNLFDTASLSLQASVDTAPSAEVFAEITTAGTDVKKLRGEADGCAGELEMYKQESRTDVDRPELDDPTDGSPFNPGEVTGNPSIDPPAYATPYK